MMDIFNLVGMVESLLGAGVSAWLARLSRLSTDEAERIRV